MPCPLCEGIGEVPPSAVETMLRAVAGKLGYRLTKIPEDRKPATDWSPVFAALSAARESLGLGPAVNTGSAHQHKILTRHPVPEWIEAIEGQRESLAESRRLTDTQRNAWMSLQTVDRNFDRCLQQARKQRAPQVYQLPGGEWVEEVDGIRRHLTPGELTSLGLE